ncbi:Uncharacterised protein [Vibrio cholerae]|uniref:Uncharacterized protein n=1 Tax=Vibrio cholerae TaxID=666 RepID=A0A656ATM6_VIBCL|nr:Uncharacterised protein [Vibrio cholerae]
MSRQTENHKAFIKQFDLVAIFHRMSESWDGLLCWAYHMDFGELMHKLSNAANMVVMVMGDQHGF